MNVVTGSHPLCREQTSAPKGGSLVHLRGCRMYHPAVTFSSFLCPVSYCQYNFARVRVSSSQSIMMRCFYLAYLGFLKVGCSGLIFQYSYLHEKKIHKLSLIFFLFLYPHSVFVARKQESKQLFSSQSEHFVMFWGMRLTF